MGNYKLTEEAKEDIIRIYTYGIRVFGLEQANIYYDNLVEYFKILSDRPYSYQIVDHLTGDYRRCVHKSNTIYFLLTGNEVLIVRVIGMQDTDKGFRA